MSPDTPRTSAAPKRGDQVTLTGEVIGVMSGGKEVRVRIDGGYEWSGSQVVSVAPEALRDYCGGCGGFESHRDDCEAKSA